ARGGRLARWTGGGEGLCATRLRGAGRARSRGVSAATLAALVLTAKVAIVATLIVLPPGIALGWVLARRAVPGKALIETLTALPLVLPPTAVGFLLLRL